MPAILRKSLPNLFASHSIIGQSLPFDVVVGVRPPALDRANPADRVGVVVLFLLECVPEVLGIAK
jgi:hypothetical protein